MIWADIPRETRSELLREAFRDLSSKATRRAVVEWLEARDITGASESGISHHVDRWMEGVTFRYADRTKGGRPRPKSEKGRGAYRCVAQNAVEARRSKRNETSFAHGKMRDVPEITNAELRAQGITGIEADKLTSKTCRFPMWGAEIPVDGGLYCGEPTDTGSVYCRHHHRLCNDGFVHKKGKRNGKVKDQGLRGRSGTGRLAGSRGADPFAG